MEDTVKDLAARATVLELMLVQTLVRISPDFGGPGVLMKAVMIPVEDTLRNAEKAARGTQDEEKARDALAYFENLTMRMIAGLTHGPKN
jgi:hypothetical protein